MFFFETRCIRRFNALDINWASYQTDLCSFASVIGSKSRIEGGVPAQMDAGLYAKSYDLIEHNLGRN